MQPSENGSPLPVFNAFQYMCSILWNASDASYDICVSITRQGMLVECTQQLVRPDVNPKAGTQIHIMHS
jgi:hypothetical protein